MSGWQITLGLGLNGPASFLLDGLGAASGQLDDAGQSQSAPARSLNLQRTLTPVFVSGYAGRDFPLLSSAADDVFGIDLGPALDAGDALDAASLTVNFFPVDVPAAGYAAALDGAPVLIGTVAAQAIGQPPPARYLLGFVCGTQAGRRIALYSFFNATGLPDAATG
jgi:hypothetical protein